MEENKFKAGDKVRVRCGEHKGHVGVVHMPRQGNYVGVKLDGDISLIDFLPDQIGLAASCTAETITTFALENTDSGLYVRCKVSSLSPNFLDAHIVMDGEEYIDLCIPRYTAEALVEVLTRALEN